MDEVKEGQQEEFGNVKVMLRVRPLNAREIERGGDICLKFLDEQTVKIKFSEEQEKTKSAENIPNFNFDRVFNLEATQQEIFYHAAKPIVEQIFQGFNGTIFAYGQTSSGKTHTMQGPSIDDQNQKGIIPRIVDHVFDKIYTSPDNLIFNLSVSIIEIYMEKIRDLLNVNNQNLQIREDKNKGIYIQDVTEEFVADEKEVYDLLDKGNINRSVGSTNMNKESSRSHMIFIMSLQCTNKVDNSCVAGKLCLVDLAGSEKIEKTGAEGKTLDEAKLINKSLSELGNVINALTDKNQQHIPYRNSKLTRVLQESLGGNARTTLIITASPSQYNELETLSTLRFGIRAKSIKNKPKINKEWTVAELLIVVQKTKEEKEIIRRRIQKLENFIVENGLTVPEGGSPVKKKSSEVKEYQEQEMDEVIGTNQILDDIDKSLDEDTQKKIEELQENIRNLEDELNSEKLISKQKDHIVQQMEIQCQSIENNRLELEKEQKENQNQLERNTQLTLQLSENDEQIKEKDEALEKQELQIQELSRKVKEIQSKNAEYLKQLNLKTEELTQFEIKEQKKLNEIEEKYKEQLNQVNIKNEVYKELQNKQEKMIFDLVQKIQDNVKNQEKSENQSHLENFLKELSTNEELRNQNLSISQQILEGQNINIKEIIQNSEEKMEKLQKQVQEKDQIIENYKIKIQDMKSNKKTQLVNIEQVTHLEQEHQRQLQQMESDLQSQIEKFVGVQMQLSEEKDKNKNLEQSIGQSKNKTKQKMHGLEKNLIDLTQKYHELLQKQSDNVTSQEVNQTKLKRKSERIMHLECNVRDLKEQLQTYKRKYEDIKKIQEQNQQDQSNISIQQPNFYQNYYQNNNNNNNNYSMHNQSIDLNNIYGVSQPQSGVSSPKNGQSLNFNLNGTFDRNQQLGYNQFYDRDRSKKLNPLLMGKHLQKPLRGGQSKSNLKLQDDSIVKK